MSSFIHEAYVSMDYSVVYTIIALIGYVAFWIFFVGMIGAFLLALIPDTWLEVKEPDMSDEEVREFFEEQDARMESSEQTGKAELNPEDAQVAHKSVSAASPSSVHTRSPEGLAEESVAPVGAGGTDIADRLAKLVQMMEAGYLTPEEFEDAKRQALGNKQFQRSSEVAPAAPAPVAPSGPNGGEATEVPEQVEFDVILESAGSQRISHRTGVAKTVRTLTDGSATESVELVKGAPKPVLQGVSEESALMAKAALVGAGATVTISPV